MIRILLGTMYVHLCVLPASEVFATRGPSTWDSLTNESQRKFYNVNKTVGNKQNNDTEGVLFFQCLNTENVRECGEWN